MRRRAPQDPSVLMVPTDVAAGPCVKLWASPEALAMLEPGNASQRLANEARDEVQLAASVMRAVQIDAHHRWSAARREWATKQGITAREMSKLLHCGVYPYFCPPRSHDGEPSNYERLYPRRANLERGSR
jgi:hypothetical protein